MGESISERKQMYIRRSFTDWSAEHTRRSSSLTGRDLQFITTSRYRVALVCSRLLLRHS